MPDESPQAWPADPDASENDSNPTEEPDAFPALPAFLVEPIRPNEYQTTRKTDILHATRRFLFSGIPGPATATILFLVAGGAAMAGALHIQDLDIGSVLGLSKSPALRVADAFGQEDKTVPLAISVSAQAGTTLEPLLISGLPDGVRLSSGKRLQNGDWSVPPKDVDNLVIIPPVNFHGLIELVVQASALNGEEIESRSAHLAVEIEAVADIPTLAVQDISGREDEPQHLGILTDLADAQESLSIEIRGLPPGATLSHGQAVGDVWSVDPSDLAALQVIPAPNFNGLFPLQVDVTAHDDDDSVLVSRGFDIRFAPVADAPILSVDWQPAREDIPVDLRIDVSLSDPNEALSVSLSGLPAGARLSAGTEQSTGEWNVAPDEAADLRLFLPPHFNGPVPLRVTATAIDGLDRATAVLTRDIDVAAEADRPLIVAADATGSEDTSMSLAVSIIVTDPKQSTTVSFLGLPSGTILSRGSAAGPQEWRLNSLEDIAELRLTPPLDYAGVSKVEVVATSTDGDSVAETRTDMVIEVVAVADPAKLVTNPVAALEDERVPLVVELETAARERVTLDITGLPANASLSVGSADDNGVWHLVGDETADLILNLPQHFAGELHLQATATTFDGDDQTVVTAPIDVEIAAVADRPSLLVADANGKEDQPIQLDLTASSPDPAEFVVVRVSGVPAGAKLTAGRDTGSHWQLEPRDLAELALIPPPQFSGDIALDVSTVAYHGLSQAAAHASFIVSIAAVADMPFIEVAAVTGLEDTVIPMTISAHVLDESEHLSLTVANLPDGATLSRGKQDNDGTWLLDPQDRLDVAFLPPENYSGTARLAITATSNDSGDTISVTAPLDVTVKPVADRPSLSVEDAIGIEDGVIVLRTDAQTPDPSESLVIRIAGLPQGAQLSAGQITDDGSWVLDSGDLRDLSLTPPGNFSGQLNLLVSATSQDGETRSSVEETLDVTLVPVADFPRLAVVSATGPINQSLPLKIDASVADEGETLAITIRGLPAGFGLSDGRDRGKGLWTLEPSQIKDLAVIPSGEASIEFDLAVSVSATDGSDRKQVTETLEVTFTDPVIADQSARLSLVASAVAQELPPAEPTVAQASPKYDGETAEDLSLADFTAAKESPQIYSVTSEVLPPIDPVAPPELLPPAETQVAAIPSRPPPETAPPTSVTEYAPPPVVSAPEPDGRIAPPLSQTQAKMVARAEEYLQVGDVIAARLLFEATANLGSANAALRAGETYDPIFLKENGFVGALPVPESATNWYRSALDLGSDQAADRIQRLESWLASSPQ
ncbi:MAG: hypothetical protein ACTSX7_19990 [Alphaproteobacteria bacterium]